MKKDIKQNQPNYETISKPASNNVGEYIALLATILFLYMDFLPPFGSIDILGTQYLYMTFLNTLLATYWFFNPDLLPKELVDHVKKSFFVKCYIVFLIMGLLSIINANNLTLWIVNFAQLLITLLTVVNLLLLFNRKKNLFFQVAFFVSVAVFVKSFSELYSFFQILKTQGLTIATAQMKGNTGNINIFSATLNLKMAFLIVCILHYNDWKKWFAATGILLSVVVIYFLDSRATFIAIILEIIAVITFLVLQKSALKFKISSTLIIILPILLGVFFSMQVIKSHTPKTIVQVAKPASQLSTSKTTKIDFNDGGSSDSRIKYWTNSAKIALKNPVFGVGMGNYRIESLPYERLEFNNLLISQHSHNDYLEIAAETGILGGLAYFLLFVSLFFLNIKKIGKTQDMQTKLIAMTMILLIIGYGIDSFFNFPLHRPSVQLLFCFLVVFSLVNVVNEQEKITLKLSKKLSVVAILVSLFTIFCAWGTFEAFKLENDIAADTMVEGNTLNSDMVKRRMPLFPNVFSNSEPFCEQLAIYLVNEKKYAEAQKYLNQAYVINPHNGRIEWYKHRISKETNKKDSAYYYAKKAFEVRPRNYDYYISMLFMANEYKDTTEMLKVHKIYDGFIKRPKNWIDTSNALHLSSYSKKNILTFIETGLKDFPNDSLLLERKKVFEYELHALKPGTTFETSNKKPVTATEKYIDFLQKAANYAAKNKFDKSLECYKEVQKTDPNNLTIVQNIGICYFKLNQFQKAIIELEKALNAPALTDGKTEYILGICYLNTQNKKQGCKYMNLAAARNFPESKQLLQQYCK